MGVFTFAIISIFGLLSVALRTSADTRRDSSTAFVIRTLEVDTLAATNASTTSALTASSRYYDITGTPTVAGSTTAFFKVDLTLASNNSAQALLPLKAAPPQLFYFWSAKIAYPPPNYPNSSVILLGSASY